MATALSVTPGALAALALDFDLACEVADQARADTERVCSARRAPRRQRRRHMAFELALLADALRAGRRLFAAHWAARRHDVPNVGGAAR